jgi:hypothetical protein
MIISIYLILLIHILFIYLNRLYQFTKIIYAIAIFLTYNLQFYVPFTLLWPRICRKILYKYNDKAKAKFEHVFRIGLILVTCKLTTLDLNDKKLLKRDFYLQVEPTESRQNL